MGVAQGRGWIRRFERGVRWHFVEILDGVLFGKAKTEYFTDTLIIV